MQNNAELQVLADNYAQHLNELIALLELEHDALTNRNFEAIRNCAEQKELLLNTLEALDAQREAIENQTIPAEAKVIHAYFKTKIEALLKKCKDINIVNAGIVEISKQFNQRMLNTILGAATVENNLYDARGNNAGNKLKQVFAKI